MKKLENKAVEIKVVSPGIGKEIFIFLASHKNLFVIGAK